MSAKTAWNRPRGVGLGAALRAVQVELTEVTPFGTRHIAAAPV
jgi:hypothetical protein